MLQEHFVTDPASFGVRILNTVDIKTQKMKCTACALQKQTRKEFNNCQSGAKLRCDGNAFHPCSIFLQNFKHTSVSWELHLSSVQAGLFCVNSKACWGPCPGKRCKHHRTKSANTWLILRANFTLGLFATNEWMKPTVPGELSCFCFIQFIQVHSF